MKHINLFGYKFTLDIKRDKNKEEEIFSEEYSLREKILYLIGVMFIIALSSKFILITTHNNYKVGDIIRSDIYAPHTAIFKDWNAKEKAIESMISKSGKEYIFSSDAEKIYLGYLNNFFDTISQAQDNDQHAQNIDFGFIERNTGKTIPTELVRQLLKLSPQKLKGVRDSSYNFLMDAYKNGIVNNNGNISYKPPYGRKIRYLSPTVREVVKIFTSPNYVYDEAKTKRNLEEKVDQIKDQYVKVKIGTLIAKKGEVVNEKKMRLFEALGIYSYPKSIMVLIGNILYLVIISILFYKMIFGNFKKDILKRNSYRATMLIIVASFLAMRILNIDLKYLIPLDVASFLLVILVGRNYAITIYSFMILFLMPIINYDLRFMAVYFIGIPFGAYVISNVSTRIDLIGAGIKLSILKVILYLLFSFFSDIENLTVAINSMYIVVSGVFSGMLTIALLPYFEKTFNILTSFRLLELGNLSHPLLKKISSVAPGTFQHSMMVSTLSENAAEAIGADSIFCRVASYYHDLGKTKRPNFYVENQMGGENPHNKISPTLSTLIITAHTKDGDDMAKEYQIPKEIRDIMYEHQGTTFLAYFYNMAKKDNPRINKDDFRYSGPKPRTKESAIIMLADSIEAAVRSLDQKNPIVMENIIRKIISAKIEDNQLSEANLTFKEIEAIIKRFIDTLMGIHHNRIKYPGQNKISTTKLEK